MEGFAQHLTATQFCRLGHVEIAGGKQDRQIRGLLARLSCHAGAGLIGQRHIEEIAAEVAGKSNVDSQLEVEAAK